MISSKPKTISRKLSTKILLLTLLSVSSGCGWFTPKERIVYIKTSDFCDKYYPLKNSSSIRKDINIISNDTFEFIKVNETTGVCECLPTEKKEQCYNDFLSLD